MNCSIFVRVSSANTQAVLQDRTSLVSKGRVLVDHERETRSNAATTA
jgi:hypothetical protein